VAEYGCIGTACVVAACQSGYRVCANGCCALNDEVVDDADYAPLSVALDPSGNLHMIYHRKNGTFGYANHARASWVTEDAGSSATVEEMHLAVDSTGTPWMVEAVENALFNAQSGFVEVRTRASANVWNLAHHEDSWNPGLVTFIIDINGPHVFWH